MVHSTSIASIVIFTVLNILCKQICMFCFSDGYVFLLLPREVQMLKDSVYSTWYVSTFLYCTVYIRNRTRRIRESSGGYFASFPACLMRMLLKIYKV